jgi:hypothetical protein
MQTAESNNHTGNEHKRVLKYPITRGKLADIYLISAATLKVWLEELGISHGRQLNPAELRKLIDSVQLPKGVEVQGI